MKHLSDEELDEVIAKIAAGLFKQGVRITLPKNFMTMSRQEILLAIASLNAKKEGVLIESQKHSDKQAEA